MIFHSVDLSEQLIIPLELRLQLLFKRFLLLFRHSELFNQHLHLFGLLALSLHFGQCLALIILDAIECFDLLFQLTILSLHLFKSTPQIVQVSGLSRCCDVLLEQGVLLATQSEGSLKTRDLLGLHLQHFNQLLTAFFINNSIETSLLDPLQGMI